MILLVACLSCWPIGAAVADLTTTEIGLSRGGVEGNPLMVARPVRIAAKAGVVTLEIWLLKRYARTHPRVVKGLTIGLVAGHAWIGYHNLGIGNNRSNP